MNINLFKKYTQISHFSVKKTHPWEEPSPLEPIVRFGRGPIVRFGRGLPPPIRLVRGNLPPTTGDGVDTVQPYSDEEDYHAQEYELPEQNPKYLDLPTILDQLWIRLRNNDHAHFSNKRMTGRQRMNHLVRFVNRRNGGNYRVKRTYPNYRIRIS